jgi:hypothetical protein
MRANHGPQDTWVRGLPCQVRRTYALRVATLEDVDRIVAALPGTYAAPLDGPSAEFGVLAGDKRKKIAWSWRKRVHPKKTKVPQLDVLVLPVATEGEKHSLIAAEPDIFFTEPHYDGYAAVLVRIADIEVDELAEIVTDAWRLVAPGALVAEYDDL